MLYTGTYTGTIRTYCAEFDGTSQITFTIDRNGVIDLPYNSGEGALNDGTISSSGQISGISVGVTSMSLGNVTIPYSGSINGNSFSVTGQSSNGIISTIQATRVVPKYTAAKDTASVYEDSTYAPSGNLLSNDTDRMASIDTVKGKAVALSGTTKIAGTYGTLTVAADGAYSYKLNNANAKVDALRDGQSLIDTFAYSGSNVGNASSATLTITILGETDPATPIYGTRGADILYGTARADAFYGDDGQDTVSYARAKSGVTAYLDYGVNKGEATDDLFYSIENLKGSSFADTLSGNYDDNLLDGGAGADRLNGGYGNDTYVVDSASDRVIEYADYGFDTIKSSVTITALAANVEKLILTGTGHLDGTGNGLSNAIIGNSGNNVIDGGAGKDILTGGAGKDTFLFKTALGSVNVDRIKDFSPVDDTIAIENAIFGGLKPGVLKASLFKDITDGAAIDGNDCILYDRDTGVLSFDADGNGPTKAVAFAILETRPTLTFQDFFVV